MDTHKLLDKALEENKAMMSKAGIGNSTESSQSIVDELFKDFISSKISSAKTKSSKTKSTQSKPKSKTTARTSNVDEISKLLDMEINSIKAHTKEPFSFKENESPSSSSSSSSVPHSQVLSSIDSSSQHSQSKSISSVNKNITSPSSQEKPADIPLPSQKPLPISKSKLPQDNEINENSNSTQDPNDFNSNCLAKISLPPPPPLKTLTTASKMATTESYGPQLPPLPVSSKQAVPLVGKMKLNIPKQLGCKLSVESLSLIKSNEKIDRKGRVWEDGEVQSSHSEDSNKEGSDSEDDGGLSETGSINSEKDWKSQNPSSSLSKHKKKHKHKHKKKKKKKSNKEKDKDKEDGDGKKNKEKDKSGKTEKDSAAISRIEKDSSSPSLRDKLSSDSSASISSKTKGKGSDTESSSKKGDKSDGRKKDKEKKRRHGRSRSRTPKKSKKSRSQSKSPKRSRKSPSPKRHRYDEWDARRYSDNPKKSRSRSRSHSPSKRRRSSERKNERSTTDKNCDKSTERKRDRSKERDRSREWKREKPNDGIDLRLQIDKAKLRKIAIANTLNTMKMGQPVPVQVDVAAVKSGGKSVEELTDFCKRISERDHERQENAISDSSEEEPALSDDEDTLIHHPFKVKETTANIVMNIRNAKQLPVLTPSEKQAQQAQLRLSFPVSSGTHHRANESEWVPVEKSTAPTVSTISVATTTQASIAPKPEPTKSIFPTAAQQTNVDIGAIISERLQAVRKLQLNPYDVQALSSMHKSQEKASQWAQSKFLPGQFTGSTGAHVMSQQEIIGDKRRQAWVKKTQFQKAAPVQGGIGMFLLQKMGWKQGEGLGKHQEGKVEPLQLDIKMDRKGLATAADNPKARPQQAMRAPLAKDLSHKHPVSALMELCNKRHWHPPSFTVVSENGPAHKKCFMFKVKVNDVEYQPSVPSSNKKTAKAQCAAVCLQELGLLSRDAPMNY